MPAILCHSCNKHFGDYRELALHISSSRKGHRKGKRWAAKYLMHVNALARDELLNRGRMPLTEGQKQSKRDAVRQLSGQQESVLAICPHCKKGHGMMLPVEFSHSREAWRVGERLVVLCRGCGG
jgi:hypothetical protein